MPLKRYTGPVRLTGRDNGLSFYLLKGRVDLRVIPFQPAEDMENPPRGQFLHGPRLGEWGGSLLVYGHDLYHYLGHYFLETDEYRGDIIIRKAEIIEGIYTKAWFDGYGDLVSVTLEKELKKAIEPHGMW